MLENLSLLELNELHAAMYNHLLQAKENAKVFGGWFKDKLPAIEALEQKISDALYIKNQGEKYGIVRKDAFTDEEGFKWS